MERRYLFALVALTIILAASIFAGCHRLAAYEAHLAAAARV